MNLYVGADISKGYADFCVMDGKGRVRHEVQMDDTRPGHDRMSDLIEELRKEVADEEELLVGMEATGGMEANWMQLFESLGEEFDLTVYRLNPFVLRKFAEQQLHAGKTDQISAKRVANYLRSGPPEDGHWVPDKEPDPGLQTLSRKTMEMVEESVDLQNELQALLQRAHRNIRRPTKW